MRKKEAWVVIEILGTKVFIGENASQRAYNKLLELVVKYQNDLGNASYLKKDAEAKAPRDIYGEASYSHQGYDIRLVKSELA